MDSLTHIALGACIGEAFFERGFGKKAMLWGALAQSIPDIDFLAGIWLNTPENLLAHRGFTHSILFALLITPILAFTARKLHPKYKASYRKWLYFFLIEVFLHLLLDGYNNYGIGWLEPFSHHRFSFNAIYVADPFFSIWAGIALLMLLLLNRYHARRRFWWRFGLLLPMIYLGYCTINKWKIDTDTRDILKQQQISYNRYFTTPTPFNNWLWFVVAGNDSGYQVGFRSLFDSKKKIAFRYFPRNDSLLSGMATDKDLQHLLRFSQQFYTVEKWNDTLVLNDLRFGQINGWQDPQGRFAFHYFLNHPGDNDLVVQRGRFKGWNRETTQAFLRRIKGN